MPRRVPPIVLTPDLVSRVPVPETPPPIPEGIVRHTDEEIEAMVRAALAGHERGAEVPVFAFGSLLWNPGITAADEGHAVARGWHRAFRMRLVMHRGTPERPGLMMGLDRGGTCHGALLSIAPSRAEQELHALFKREMPVRRPNAEMYHGPRWIGIETPSGRRRAIAFVMNPRGLSYTGRIGVEEQVEAIATAAGGGGSCAEYLYQTVVKLAERGIHDRNLWRLQALVAERLAASGAAGR